MPVCGSIIRNGVGAPANSLGVRGDYYINTSNGDMYVKGTTSYSIVMSLKGPAGVAGATGATGATGSAGAVGPSGSVGLGVNVVDNGLVGDGTTDNSPALQALVNASPEGTRFLVPHGLYKFNSTVDFSSLEAFSLEGESASVGGGSTGAVFITLGPANPMISVDYGGGNGTFDVRNISFQAYDGSTAFYTSNSVRALFEHCYFFGGIGLDFSSAFGGLVSNCQFNSCSSIGLQLFGPTGSLVSNCNFIGCGEGLRSAGTGASVIGSQFEVCGTGIRLGADPNGNNWGFSRGVFQGISMEACDTFIYCQVVAGCQFAGIGMGGSAGSPSSGSQRGIYLFSANHNVFSGIAVGGSYTVAGVKMYATPENTKNCFDSVIVSNSGMGALWDIPVEAVGNEFRCSNYTP